MIITRIALTIWLTAAVSHGHKIEQNITLQMRFGTAVPRGGLALANPHRSRGRDEPGVPEALAYADLHQGGRTQVFLDRVERLENSSIVLAHLLVHEVTHVIQGVNRHSETGVLKAYWTGQDYAEMRVRRPRLAPEDLELIRHGVAACPYGMWKWPNANPPAVDRS